MPRTDSRCDFAKVVMHAFVKKELRVQCRQPISAYRFFIDVLQKYRSQKLASRLVDRKTFLEEPIKLIIYELVASDAFLPSRYPHTESGYDHCQQRHRERLKVRDPRRQLYCAAIRVHFTEAVRPNQSSAAIYHSRAGSVGSGLPRSQFPKSADHLHRATTSMCPDPRDSDSGKREHASASSGTACDR